MKRSRPRKQQLVEKQLNQGVMKIGGNTNVSEGCEVTIESMLAKWNEDEDKARRQEATDFDEDDIEKDGLIRIRSSTDPAIFQENDEDDEDEDIEVMSISSDSEVDMTSTRPFLSFQQWDQDAKMKFSGDTLSGGNAQGLERLKKLPLYLLNPNDYADNPEQQERIRRAIITKYHHESKNKQLMLLRKENKNLRAYEKVLQQKAKELQECGCKKNQSVDLTLLNVNIPEVPPTVCLGRPKKPKAPVTNLNVKVKAEPPIVAEAPKPFINIASSKIANLNIRVLPPNAIIAPQLLSNATPGKPLFVQRAPGSNTAVNARTTTYKFPSSLLTEPETINCEPDLSTMGLGDGNGRSVANGTIRIPMMENKRENLINAAHKPTVPASRIVFVRRGSNQNAIQIASRLLSDSSSSFRSQHDNFGTDIGTEPQKAVSSTNSKSFGAALTASQLALGNRAWNIQSEVNTNQNVK